MAIGVKRMEYLAVRWRKPFTSTLVTRGSGEFLGFKESARGKYHGSELKTKNDSKTENASLTVPNVVEV